LRVELKQDGTLFLGLGPEGSGNVLKLREDPLHPGVLMISDNNVDDGEMLHAWGERGEPIRYLGIYSVFRIHQKGAHIR